MCSFSFVGTLTAPVTFTTLALINTIRFPFTFLPLAASFWVQLMVSFKRIEQFLQKRELDNDDIAERSAVGVSIHHCDFYWDEPAGGAAASSNSPAAGHAGAPTSSPSTAEPATPVLSDISLEVNPGIVHFFSWTLC
jgi:hypothetical protein